jgi:hypothetical protein
MERIGKLHRLATIQQPQIYPLINEVEFRLTDLYIIAKAKKQTTIEDFLKKNQVLCCN